MSKINIHAPSSIAGSFIAVLLGLLSTTLVVGFWALFATIFGGIDSSISRLWTILTGAVIGLTLAYFRNKISSNTIIFATGAVAAILWLIFTKAQPLAQGASVFWNIGASFISFILAAYLTQYGLRDMKLDAVNRNMLELTLTRIMRALAYLFFLTIIVLPFYFMIAASFKSRAEILQNPTDLSIPFAKGFSELFVGYREVLFSFNFLRYIGNSSFVAVVTVVVTLILAVLGAYAVTRLRFPGRKMLSRSILLIYMFPAIVLVIPLYSIFTQLGLRDSLLGLLIVYPATTLPVALYMLKSYFETLPKDLEEAGMMDGLTRLGVIWRITLPLSLPALASVGLYVFMIAWNEFLFAFMFIDSPAIFTLSRGMVGLNGQEVPRQFLMAGAVIVTVPIMLIFFWFEKYMVGGLTAGGVKG